MAKVSNETKLVMALLKERMAARRTDLINAAAWREGIKETLATLDFIVSELEAK